MGVHAIKNAVIARFNAAKRFRASHCFANASIDTWFERTYRMYNGIHHPDEIDKEHKLSGVDLRNVAYYPFARLKVDAARVWVDGTYSHAIDAPFILEPTRNPQLNDDQKGEVSLDVARLLSEMLGAGQLDYGDVWDKSNKQVKDPQVSKWLKKQVDSAATTYNDKAKMVAQEACEFRQNYMADQLDAGGWTDAWGLTTHNLMAEPYTALCARESKSIITSEWRGNKVKQVSKTVPSFRAIDPRSLYLAPDASSAQDGNGVTELTIRSRADLISMLKMEGEGVCKDGVMAALANLTHNPDGAEWLDIKSGHALAANETHSLVHQGLFSGKELGDAGVTGYDLTEYFNVTVEVCFDEVIRMEVLPYEHNLRNYYTAQHTKSSSSYAGESVLTKLYHIQNQLNTAVFLRDRNLYMSSGSSFIVHSGYFNRLQDLNLTPYSRNMAAVDLQNGGRGIEQIRIDPQYMQQQQQIDALKREGDEQSGVLSGLSGLSRGGVTRTTATGAVLDQTAGERMMNAAVLNLDRTLIEPMVKHLDRDNMQYEEIPKHYRRGDVVVRGRGINGLREIELKGRLLSEALPIAAQANQAGKVPDEMLEDAYKGYFDSKGLDTSSMPSRASQREISAAGLNPPQKNDRRMYNPQQSMIGVA